MKTKAVILLLTAFFIRPAFAQDDDKSFKFGLKAVPSINWYKPEDAKKFESAGTNLKFGYGLMTEFKLAGSAWLSTGLQVDYDGGRIHFKDTVGYFANKDGEIIAIEDTTGQLAQLTAYKLNERKYRTTYVTLPLTLRLRTKEVGMMTYFGQFGFPLSIKLKGRCDDKVNAYTMTGFGNETENTALDISNDMGFMNVGLTIGGGAEYNMSGNTSILFGINYTQGFMNTVRRDSKQLLNDAAPPTALEQKFFSRNVGLTVGILF
ncbi:MAG: outer membrane beta-barrel protein [Bacteroidia bacterium]|nr:outer membrane beta-barrel protein [Bacteroidia bacterium]